MKKTITSFVNNEYKSYSKYVLSSRSIPSVIDGLKSSQRKILYTTIKTASTKKIKTASLSGNCISQANYHHGPASLDGAIPAMVAPWNNNAPLLEGEGNFGSRLINEPAAARYTYSGLHSNYTKYFPDDDILFNYASDDIEDPEPRYYLPIIPWILVNGIKGIAIGYATEIQPRHPHTLKKLCIDYLNGKNIDRRNCLPHYNNFTGDIFVRDNKYICRGTYEQLSKTKIRITELPVGIEREKYISILDRLDDDGHIVSYIDNCSKAGFDFTITFKRNTNMTEARIIRMFKLEKILNENLTTIDETGSLLLFDNVIDIIKYFCDWRYKQYKVRYDYYLKRDNEMLDFADTKLRFIHAVNSGRIVMKNKTLSDIHKQISIYDKKYWPKLLSLSILQFSLEHVDKLRTHINELNNAIYVWENVDYDEEFIKDLKGI